MAVLIDYTNVEIRQADQIVLHDVNLHVENGEMIYLLGKVGSGKSSLMKTIYGALPITAGQAKVLDYDLTKIPRRKLPYLRRRLGIIFQDYKLLTDRTVADNLLFVLRATGWKDKNAVDRRIREVLDDVGMSHKAHKMPHQLSGGEQQRIAIARSLLNRPKLIIADEPTGNLDNETADGILRLLTSINNEDGTAIVMVTHNRNIFEKYRGRIFVCKDESCEENVNDEVIDLALTI